MEQLVLKVVSLQNELEQERSLNEKERNSNQQNDINGTVE